MENWIQDALNLWELSDTKLNPPASISEIEKAEEILKFKFPEDFKQLYLIVNGFKDLDWQKHMFCFWHLDLIIEEFENSSDKNFIGFCDFLLSSYMIGFVKNQAGIFKSYDYLENNRIADTYQEVVGMINSSADTIY
jgi:hypothetical protein